MRCLIAFTSMALAGLSIAGCGAEQDQRTGRSTSSNKATSVDNATPLTRHRHKDRELADRPRDLETRRSTRRNSSIQAGTLTAGSIDDNAKFDEFRSYLSSAMQNAGGSNLPGFEFGRRIVIRVIDSDGNGIGDAGDQYVTRTFNFTSALDGFRRNLAAQSANGGGDYPEAMHLALEQAEQLSWRRSKAARVLFLDSRCD